MPAFYNGIYFSTKYANALWNGESEDVFSNITILTEQENVEKLRNIIKSNFLYLSEWDSVRFTNGDDYGFSFIVGNIKFILMGFKETADGYIVRSYDVDQGDCYETHLVVDKKYFLDVSIRENGDIVRVCDFNLEYINNGNSKKFRAEKKAGPEMLVYKNNSGYALANMYLYMIVLALCIIVVLFAYTYMKIKFYG